MNEFLYFNPIAPAVVGLFVFAILGWYAMTRRDVARGTLPEGPAAAHPLALLVQSLLVLLREKRLLLILLASSSLAAVIWLPIALAPSDPPGHTRSLVGPMDWEWVARDVARGASALESVRKGLPGGVPLGGDLGAYVLALLGACLLLWLVRRRPGWMDQARATKATAIAAASLVGVAWQVFLYLPGGRETLCQWTDALPGLDVALMLVGVPAVVLAVLLARAAIYELVVSGSWSPSDVARRCINAYVPYLGWTVLVASLASLVFPQHPLWRLWEQPLWSMTLGISLTRWLTVLLFALPWLLLERERSLLDALGRSLRLWRQSFALMLTFSVRLAAVLAPAPFILRALALGFAYALALCSLCELGPWMIGIVACMAECRAFISISDEQARAALEGPQPPDAE